MFRHQWKINNHIFSYQGRLYTSLHFINQAPYANIHVSNLVYLPLFWWLAMRFFNHNWWLKIFYVSNEKFLGFVQSYNLLEYFPNKEIDSIKLCVNTSIQMNLSKNSSFLIEEAINFIAHTEKEGISMWNAWVLCVFVLFYHGHSREAGLQLLYHLSLRCFVNKVMTFWYYAVTKSFMTEGPRSTSRGPRSASGLSVSCAKHH